jgi:hypothetical protein
MSDDVSKLAFQGFLEKTGLSINESESLKEITLFFAMSYLECQAQYRRDGYGKGSKASAAITAMATSILDNKSDDDNFLLLRGCVACAAYQHGNAENFEHQLGWIKEACNAALVELLLSDETRVQMLKEQYIKSKALGTRKGVWSKLFG